MRVGITDGTSVGGGEVWDSLDCGMQSADFAQLELSLSGSNAVSGEASLGIIQEAESFVGPLDGNNV